MDMSLGVSVIHAQQDIVLTILHVRRLEKAHRTHKAVHNRFFITFHLT
jgi:hypothetical protein